MAYTGYHFYVGSLELPYAPSELKVTIGSNNKTVELINGDSINILKNPKLTEIEFEIELPRGRQYGFANKLTSSKRYTDYFERLMLNKTPTELVIIRPNPIKKRQPYKQITKEEVKHSGTATGATIGSSASKQAFESTVLKVSLEGYDLKESADNAYDIKVALKFKEYVSYGTVKQVIKNQTAPNTNGNQNTSTTQQVTTTTKPNEETKKHKVVKGDTLWNISRKYYGTGDKWKTIYEANKTVIEEAAKKNGKASSSNGNWIFPGTELVIPADSK